MAFSRILGMLVSASLLVVSTGVRADCDPGSGDTAAELGRALDDLDHVRSDGLPCEEEVAARAREDESVYDRVARLLHHDDPRVRRLATRVLAATRTDAALERLIREASTDPDQADYVREQVARYYDPEDVDRVTRRLVPEFADPENGRNFSMDGPWTDAWAGARYSTLTSRTDNRDDYEALSNTKTISRASDLADTNGGEKLSARARYWRRAPFVATRSQTDPEGRRHETTVASQWFGRDPDTLFVEDQIFQHGRPVRSHINLFNEIVGGEAALAGDEDVRVPNLMGTITTDLYPSGRPRTVTVDHYAGPRGGTRRLDKRIIDHYADAEGSPRDRQVEEYEYAGPIEADDVDVLGVGFFPGHTPQNLIEMLGQRARGESLYRQTTLRSSIDPATGRPQTAKTVTWHTADHRIELVATYHDAWSDQSSLWTLRKRNRDGTYDEQTFFAGLDDSTVVTRWRSDDRWIHRETTAELPSIENDNVPERQHTTTSLTEQGSLTDIDALGSTLGDPRLASSPVLRAFRGLAGDAPLRIHVNRDTQTARGGGPSTTSYAVAQTPDGDRLIALRRSGQPTLVYLQDRNGRETLDVLSHDGPIRTVRDTDMLDARQLHLPNLPSCFELPDTVSPRSHRGLLLAAVAAQPAGTALGAFLPQGAAQLQTLAFFDDLASMELSSVLHFVGYQSRGAATTVAWGLDLAKKAAGLSKVLYWVSAGGAAVITGVGVYRLANGETVGGALDVTVGTATLAAIIGPALGVSWLGPVGWTIAGIAALGNYVWDAQQAKQIAPVRIGTYGVGRGAPARETLLPEWLPEEKERIASELARHAELHDRDDEVLNGEERRRRQAEYDAWKKRQDEIKARMRAARVREYKEEIDGWVASGKVTRADAERAGRLLDRGVVWGYVRWSLEFGDGVPTDDPEAFMAHHNADFERYWDARGGL